MLNKTRLKSLPGLSRVAYAVFVISIFLMLPQIVGCAAKPRHQWQDYSLANPGGLMLDYECDSGTNKCTCRGMRDCLDMVAGGDCSSPPKCDFEGPIDSRWTCTCTWKGAGSGPAR